ncbi:MAG: hypothetical protein ACM30I_08985 [Gemmatimonas sp.]
MKLVAEIAGSPRRFEIRSEEMRDGDHTHEWFRVYVYEDGRAVDDFIHHTLTYAKERAEAKYAVPRTAWRVVEE